MDRELDLELAVLVELDLLKFEAVDLVLEDFELVVLAEVDLAEVDFEVVDFFFDFFFEVVFLSVEDCGAAHPEMAKARVKLSTAAVSAVGARKAIL